MPEASLPAHESEAQSRAATLGIDVPYKRALIVANPIAGRGTGENAAVELATALGRRGVAVEVFLTGAQDEARVRVRCADPETDLVVAVGGDGTIGEVLSGLINDEIPVGVLPMGTSNVLSLDTGIPRDVDSLLEVLLAGRTQTLDLARVNGHTSFLCTGVGIDGAICKALGERRTGPITKWSYFKPSLDCLLKFKAPRLRVTLDGDELEGDYGFVVASNIIHYAGYLKFARDRKLDDGLLEVYLFKHGRGLPLLEYAVRGLLGRLPGGSCTMARAKHLTVTADEPVPYQVDGDYRGVTPLELEVTGRQVQLLVPKPLS